MSKPEKVVVDKVINYPIKEVESEFTSKDSIIYSLGIGFSKDPMNEEDLKYTYELNQDFTVFPTVGATFLLIDKVFIPLTECPGMPKFNPMMLLHGEHKMEFFKPVQPNVKLVTTGKISDVADKGKGAFVTFEITTYEIDDAGKRVPLLVNHMGLFIRGLGGFGFKGNSNTTMPKIPERVADKIVEDKTVPNQAIFYRLAGDTNPLHIDPNMAAMGGFDKPILHGLCSYGISSKLVVQAFCEGDVNRLKSIQARFTSHVFPGETLVLSGWKDGNKVIFSAKTAERGKEVIQGVAELNDTPSAKL
jgi:acyl dehydratase